ncbi:MAG: 3-hydroxyacyl-CoA dehydrogenase family protein [Actinobacteria bacterium]|nr:3-hydroxyacyl-CoA dehydrogenase family protein [Actinomycetota bacterium]
MLNEALPGDIRLAAVVGAGLMGRRIAGVLAQGGADVIVHDARAESIDEAVEVARAMAAESATPGTVTGSVDLADAVTNADYITEAIIEDVDAKAALIETISALNDHAIIATNTSVIPVSSIAARATGPDRVVGTHWWNPPDLIPIVEVVKGEHTSVEVMQRTVALLEHLGKLAVWVERDVPGFVGNRLQHALWREAIALVAEGVCDAETVDLVCRNTIGLRLAQMGPIETADYVGLDLTMAIHDAVLHSLNTDGFANPLLATMIERGDLGAKTGRGFLEWPPGRREERAAALAAHVSSQLTN